MRHRDRTIKDVRETHKHSNKGLDTQRHSNCLQFTESLGLAWINGHAQSRHF